MIEEKTVEGIKTFLANDYYPTPFHLKVIVLSGKEMAYSTSGYDCDLIAMLASFANVFVLNYCFFSSIYCHVFVSGYC